MRWDLISAAALLAAIAIISVGFRLPSEVPLIVLAVVTTAAGLVFPSMGEQVRIAWVCTIFVLGIVAIVAVYRGRSDQERQAAASEEKLERRYNEDRALWAERHEELKDKFELLKDLTRSTQAASEEIASLRKGTKKYTTLSLCGSILNFLLLRQRDEPEQRVAIIGAMPMPVGDYAEYIFETGELYKNRFGDQVQASIADLKSMGLSDPQLDAIMHAVPTSHVVNQIAERLSSLAGKLPD